MKIRVVSVAGCDSARETIALIHEVCTELNISFGLEPVIVSTEDQARQYCHIGSPTVQVDGLDIEPEARNAADFGLC